MWLFVAFAFFECVQRFHFRLLRVPSRRAIGVFAKLLLGTGEIGFSCSQMKCRKIRSTRLPRNGNRLTGVAHFLNWRCGLTGHEAAQGRQQPKLQVLFQTLCEILIYHGFFDYFSLGYRPKLPICGAPSQARLSALTMW